MDVRKWASMGHQRLLVLYVRLLKCELVVVIITQCSGRIDPQKRTRYSPCPIITMSINVGSTIFRPVSQVIKMWITRCYLYSSYCPSLSAKENALLSLPHHHYERQQIVNDFLPCKSGYYHGNWSSSSIIILLTLFPGKRESDTLPAPSSQWVSTERQWFLDRNLE